MFTYIQLDYFTRRKNENYKVIFDFVDDFYSLQRYSKRSECI